MGKIGSQSKEVYESIILEANNAHHHHRRFRLCRHRLTTHLIAAGHTVTIADKNDSQKYPQLRVYADDNKVVIDNAL
jgi:hypothetical protein